MKKINDPTRELRISKALEKPSFLGTNRVFYIHECQAEDKAIIVNVSYYGCFVSKTHVHMFFMACKPCMDGAPSLPNHLSISRIW